MNPDAVESLMPLSAAWLDAFGSDSALGDLVDAGTQLWLDAFTAQASDAYVDKAVEGFRDMLVDYLNRTTDPEGAPTDAQVRRVAVWLATVAHNDATWQGFQANGTLRGRWIAHHDEKVRPTHRAAHGQIRSVLGTFDVGGAKLRYPGDPKGPLNEVMECRCRLASAMRVRTRRNGLVAGAGDDFDDRPWALVTLLPAESDPVDAASSEDITHMTFVWFGEPGDEFDLQSIAMDVKQYAAKATPITVPVRERGVLGDDEADVVFLEPTESLLALRDGLMEYPAVREAHDAVEQYPEWTPHVTLGYPEAPALGEYDGTEITFDRFALWIGNDRMEFPMSGSAVTASAAIDLEVDDELTEIPEDVDMDDEDLVDQPLIEIPVHGVATIEGKPTGDGRMFALGSLTNRPLPLPMRYEFVGTHGGDTSMVAPVGRIDELWKVQVDGFTEYRYRGVIITTKAYANEALEGIADGSLTGVSVETDDWAIDTTEERERFKAQIMADMERAKDAGAEPADAGPMQELDEAAIDELVDAFIGDGTMSVTTFSSARVCGFTIVPIPAYHEGYIALGHAFPDELSEEDQAALAACGCYDAAGPEDEENPSVELGYDAFREVDSEERKRLAKEGNALPDGSFPIANVDDLKNAIQAIGRAKDPAAAKAHIKKRARALGHPELIPEDWALSDLDEELEAIIAAAYAPGTKDGPGWITHPRATARIRRYWTHGKGAAKIRWGAPGDFNRCRTQLAKYVQNPDWLAGLCANMHKEVLGFWPGEHHSARGLLASGEKRPSSIDPFMRLVDITEESTPLAIVAGAGWPDHFDSAAFANPNLTEETPITFTDDGRVYGHIATWTACHIGMDGVCQNPPASHSGYRYFRKGLVDTEKGEVTVGCITFGTGHIGIRANAAQATAHYDKPQAVRAYVAVGEDAIGIWFAGVVKPGLSKADIAEFKALGAVSGDWRWVKGKLELVGVTAVNANGFQIERKQALVAAANGHQLSLIPPPVLPPRPEAIVAAASVITPADIAAAARIAAQEVLHQQELAPRRAAVLAVRDQVRADRIARVRASREG